MSTSKEDDLAVISRRKVLTNAAGIGTSLFLGRYARAGAKEQLAQSGAKVCVLTPQAVEGPFYFDPKLVRSDITEGKQGTPLLLTLQAVEAKDCGSYLASLVIGIHRN